VLLDNMDDATVAEAVQIAAGRVKLEVSGNVTLERLPRLAQIGVDFVSMGALTHSARRWTCRWRSSSDAEPAPAARPSRSAGVPSAGLSSAGRCSLHPLGPAAACSVRREVPHALRCLGLLLVLASGCASTRVCGGGHRPGAAVTSRPRGSPRRRRRRLGNQKDDDLRKQISGRP
jgi:hypothetical protein